MDKQDANAHALGFKKTFDAKLSKLEKHWLVWLTLGACAGVTVVIVCVCVCVSVCPRASCYMPGID